MTPPASKRTGAYLIEIRRVEGGWDAALYRWVGLDLAAMGPTLRAPTIAAMCSRLIGRLRRGES